MSKENLRMSIIDGSVEPYNVSLSVPKSPELVPVFEEKAVIIQTLEGPETVIKKVLKGFRERREDE